VAIKRLRLNDEGKLEERTLDKSELPLPPAKPVRVPREPRSSSRTSSGETVSKRVKVTKRASKTFASGKSALDHDVIRFECPKCGSSRVGTDETTGLACSMCQIPMRRLR
jgi:predicted RNA-binding Zn-ribbon protein involved in translation (DUF1610 family)